MELGLSDNARPLYDAAVAFIRDRILPVEEACFGVDAGGNDWALTPEQHTRLEELKSAARDSGLWNLWRPGSGLSTVDYAHVAEATGRSRLAAEVFNCSAPDTGNMELLENYATAEQKKRWLEPLLAGEIRSAYAMTEPDVASSDATNIAARAVLENGEWCINGEKTFITGAGDERCRVLIAMLCTDPEADRHARHSQIIVPKDTPGVQILRGMQVFGSDDAPHGHMHIRFDNARVPAENLVHKRGAGFEVAQGRLGPGRVHHCMRAIGVAERALELMCRRGMARVAFGRPLAELGGNPDRIANARINIDMARLLILQTAWMIDRHGVRNARAWISKIKAAVPGVVLGIIDDAIQLHGAAGVSQDTPLAGMYTSMRTLRLADGPDEVHRRVVFRAELERYR